MKKILACLLCVLLITMFTGCIFSPESPEENTDISESAMPPLDSQQNSTETPQPVLDAIAVIENTYVDEGYSCEYIGDDMLKVTEDGTFYINVNEDEEDTDEAFYSLRLYTDATDNPDADSEGTIARFYVRKSTGAIYLMDFNNGTLTEMTVEYE